jgi:ribosome-binding protein aMBF1 (putative translation factor)
MYGPGHNTRLYYCNICGCRTNLLKHSHNLNEKRQRTGSSLHVCGDCHDLYHEKRKDYQYWGHKAHQKKKPGPPTNLHLVRLGLKYKKNRRH